MRSRLSSQASGTHSEKPGSAWWIPPLKLSLGLQREALLSGENNEQCKLAWPPCNEEDPSLPTHFETPPNGSAFTWTKCNTTPLCLIRLRLLNISSGVDLRSHRINISASLFFAQHNWTYCTPFVVGCNQSLAKCNQTGASNAIRLRC